MALSVQIVSRSSVTSLERIGVFFLSGHLRTLVWRVSKKIWGTEDSLIFACLCFPWRNKKANIVALWCCCRFFQLRYTKTKGLILAAPSVASGAIWNWQSWTLELPRRNCVKVCGQVHDGAPLYTRHYMPTSVRSHLCEQQCMKSFCWKTAPRLTD